MHLVKNCKTTISTKEYWKLWLSFVKNDLLGNDAVDTSWIVLYFYQTCDLTAVFLGVKFTCKFTLKEIQERWYALLYDPIMSKWVSLSILHWLIMFSHMHNWWRQDFALMLLPVAFAELPSKPSSSCIQTSLPLCRRGHSLAKRRKLSLGMWSR